ncbi:MAG TPA: glycosyltransferase, partial [Candidatus Methanomethylophilaceae archaeon]|nr:glycosyltransferase [Candidatus Methanomethylophilaceae archaeon]
MKVSIVIPTINEADSIRSVLEELQRAFTNSGMKYEIVIVDTDSD